MNSRYGRGHIVAAAMAACVLAGAATSADATQLWYGTFNGAYGGASVENVGGPDQELGKFLVIGSGNTNIYKSGEGGVNCGTGFTSCMSLEASNLTQGTIRTLDLSNPMGGSQFKILGGDAVTVSFELSGNQRSADPTSTDRFLASLFYDPVVDVGAVLRAGPWTSLVPVDPPAGNGFGFTARIAAGTGFQTYSISFVAPQDMQFAFQISGFGPLPNDGLGPILRSVSVDVADPAGGVPEPATWAMMLLGFGGLGGVLRRRRVAYA
ncbi:MAG: PEPxxWA-CTERM sorting domain-containing protein [Phenylobacterium sp.]|uniref:PEPxxWA-CTERM sorting domain-containing protein n=1 Tax=Phenylobacterium sp. TaxID=1871053 RepID=UPI001A4C1679|nr:PEPxxWA-CTERM sorting domain-containing protein [Phenylobacterium sp.]MBL8554548.1 PEPxxWA-CTERM sorting domain-containing protein [Phenylobacterium sp.]